MDCRLPVGFNNRQSYFNIEKEELTVQFERKIVVINTRLRKVKFRIEVEELFVLFYQSALVTVRNLN
jgi:hypothetical protein